VLWSRSTTPSCEATGAGRLGRVTRIWPESRTAAAGSARLPSRMDFGRCAAVVGALLARPAAGVTSQSPAGTVGGGFTPVSCR